MKQVFISKGEVVVEEVPAPLVQPGMLLVRVANSCISIGTEMSAVRSSGTPLWKRAVRQPEAVKRVLRTAAREGVSKAIDMVKGPLESLMPTGYSAAGTVVETGEGIVDISPGDRVACGGSQFSHHAEVIRVPRNLVVPIPENLEFRAASTVTLGAIALQGVRRASPTIGETFVVMGLGILGQLTVQILKASGCRTIGSDLDPTRIDLARKLGMDIGILPEEGIDIEHVARVTEGAGADGVIVTAASPSDSIISTAFRMCRKKGRVVLVGDVGLHLNRSDFYEKELDFLISTSYGPGRYDQRYEEEGLDYPLGYVRWTENRNMCEYLRLVSEGKVTVDPMMSESCPMEEAPGAYEALSGDRKPLLVILSYPEMDKAEPPARVVPNPKAIPGKEGRIRIAVIGAGAFASEVHLPNICAMKDVFHLRGVANASGHKSAEAARRFHADYATTDYSQILRDPDVDAVLIATRHHLHGRMVLDALEAGKHVFVEKPLCITREELDRIVGFIAARSDETSVPILMTGFNRRFSPVARRIAESVRSRSNPMIVNYRMNAGYLPPDHWVHSAEGGGRNIGEACHIYDLFIFLTGSRVVSVSAQAIRPTTMHYLRDDNFIASIRFEDGSVAALTYTSLGGPGYPKEQMELFVDGKAICLTDYQRLEIAGGKGEKRLIDIPGKGHKEALKAFSNGVKEGGDFPIPFWEQVQSSKIAFRVEQMLKEGKSINQG